MKLNENKYSMVVNHEAQKAAIKKSKIKKSFEYISKPPLAGSESENSPTSSHLQLK